MAYDSKYGKITVEYEPGNRFGDGEPVFLLRGRDVSAVTAVREAAEHARLHGASAEYVEAVNRAADDMGRWQVDNPDLLKVPD